MKKICSCLLLLLNSCGLFAQTIGITGKLTVPKKDSILLTQLNLVKIPVKVGKDGSFASKIPGLKAGFYDLEEAGQVYLEPGYDLRLVLKADSSYGFEGKGSKENRLAGDARRLAGEYVAMGQSHLLFRTYHMETDSFLLQLDAYRKKAWQLLDGSTSETFRKIAKGDIDFYCKKLLNEYVLYYGVDSVKQERVYKYMESAAAKARPASMDSAYQTMFIKKLSREERGRLKNLADSGWNMNDSLLFLNSVSYREVQAGVITGLLFKSYAKHGYTGRENEWITRLQIVDAQISNPYIREYYSYHYVRNLIMMSKDSLLKDSIYHAYMDRNSNRVYREGIGRSYKNSLDFGNNKWAPDFSFAGIDGEKVSLSRLRGQYVYIDVWATWCGPCKAEIPHLAKVEEDYKGKNIHFISLSVDNLSDTDKWKDYVRSHQLGGIQLMADNAFESDFIRKFNINSIPRFILIAPDGRIVAADAKRPSDPGLRTQLDGLLEPL